MFFERVCLFLPSLFAVIRRCLSIFFAFKNNIFKQKLLFSDRFTMSVTVARSIPSKSKIFLFYCFGNETKRSVEFRHTMCSVSIYNWTGSGEWMSTLASLYLCVKLKN